MTGESFEQHVTDLIAKQFAAIDACTPDWDSARQIRFLRLLTEKGLDELEALDRDCHEFVRDCIHLAGENMQDARLQFLEAQVHALRNPKFNLAETLLEGALILVGELVIAWGAYYAVPALMTFVATRKLLRLKDEIAAGTQKAVDVAGDLSQIDSALSEAISEARRLLETMHSLGRDKWMDSLVLRAKALGVRSRIAKLKEQKASAEVALDTSREVARRASAEFNKVITTSKLRNVQFREFLHELTGSTILGRIGETAGQDLAEVSMDLRKKDAGELLQPFTTSSITGDFLAAVHAERAQWREAWSNLRLRIRFMTDTQFMESPLVRELVALIYAARIGGVDIGTFSDADRQFYILGFEVLLWRYWLACNGALDVVPFEEALDEFNMWGVGQIVEGRLIKKHYPEGGVENTKSYMDGDYYPGILKLNEDQAKYLYNRFARQYFIANPQAMPEPLKFDADRYDKVWTMSQTSLLFFDNAERTQLLDQIKLMVIIYFQRMAEQVGAQEGSAPERIRREIREQLGLKPGDEPLKKILESLPEGLDAPGPPALSSSGTTDALNRLGTLLGATGMERKWQASDARAQLEAAITDLDLKISTYPVRSALSPSSSTAARAEAADVLDEITELQDRVRARHEVFLQLAAGEDQMLSEFNAQFAERMRKLMAWCPEQYSEQSWKWYGSSVA